MAPDSIRAITSGSSYPPLSEKPHRLSFLPVSAKTLQLMRLQLKRNGDTITILIEPKYALVLKENGYTEWYSIRRKPHFLKHHLSLILFSEKSSDKLVDVKPFLLWSSHWFCFFHYLLLTILTACHQYYAS